MDNFMHLETMQNIHLIFASLNEAIRIDLFEDLMIKLLI